MLCHLWAPLRAQRPRRRGGWRQRLDAESDDAADVPRGRMSELFGGLLLDWCDGSLSSAKLQRHAARGVRDGFNNPMASRIAGVGVDQHSHEGLMNLLESCAIPQLLTTRPGERVTEFMMPSTWTQWLHQYPHEFKFRLGAERNKLRR